MSRTVSAAARVLRVFKALKGHTVTGLSNAELAQLAHDSPSNITRAMQTLIEEGMAVKLDNGRGVLFQPLDVDDKPVTPPRGRAAGKSA